MWNRRAKMWDSRYDLLSNMQVEMWPSLHSPLWMLRDMFIWLLVYWDARNNKINESWNYGNFEHGFKNKNMAPWKINVKNTKLGSISTRLQNYVFKLKWKWISEIMKTTLVKLPTSNLKSLTFVLWGKHALLCKRESTFVSSCGFYQLHQHVECAQSVFWHHCHISLHFIFQSDGGVAWGVQHEEALKCSVASTTAIMSISTSNIFII